jgi:hypothetical protein
MSDPSGMQPVEVVARFDVNGRIIPLSFSWRNNKYSVISKGRQWTDPTGQHFMVMVPGEQVFELLFIPKQLRWFLSSRGRTWL